MLIGFSIPLFLHWVPLALVGISSQIFKQKLRSWQEKTLLALWVLIALGGIFLNAQVVLLNQATPIAVTHWAAWWLGFMAVPQVLTGIILKKPFQMILGIIWGAAAYFLWEAPLGIQETFFATALITGIPYLLIAFSKKTL